MAHRTLLLLALVPIALLTLQLIIAPPFQMLTSLTARTASRLPRIFRLTRANSTMPSSFTLDPAIFNPTLYTQITNIWLPGVDLRGEALPHDVLKRWFMLTGAERDAFDSTCRAHFAHALDAIGPHVFSPPTAQPFIDEIDSKLDAGDAAWTALSLTLLLDQIPRNVYRTDEGLRKVYTHYDSMAYALSQTLLARPTRPDTHPQWRQSAAHRLWFYLPLMHSENLGAHNLLDKILVEATQDCERAEGSKGFVAAQVKAEKEHRAILERFGRYPHRNRALGRGSTGEEGVFLREGGATFGV
ncbi:DUF924-domain-containing protein, partial [Ophiobolus disseminans]